MTSPTGWFVRFSTAAERDIREIHEWTHDRYGPLQARTYAAAIEVAAAKLETGPTGAGVKERADVAPGLFSLRIKMGRRRGRHQLYFHAVAATKDIVVVRVLHDAMDPGRHIAASD